MKRIQVVSFKQKKNVEDHHLRCLLEKRDTNSRLKGEQVG